jgi:succinoglycan biosynthesis transport protein ExoP
MTATMSEQPERQLDLSDYGRVLKRRKWTVLAITILGTALAVILSLRQAKVYQASAQVLISTQSLSAPVTGGVTVNPAFTEDPARYATTQASVARDVAVAQLAIADARLGDRSAAGLLANSSVTSNPNADILIFTVNDASPSDAAALASAYAAAFTAYDLHLETSPLQNARNELDSRLAALRAPNNQNPALYKSLVASEQQLHTMQLLQSRDTVISQSKLGAQIKPTPKREALLGLGFGLLLGLAVAFLLDGVDKRVRLEDDVEHALGLPQLGRLSEPPHRLREKPGLTMLTAPMSRHADAVRRLVTSVEFSNPDAETQMLMITSASEREGKSTTAANLAVALARRGHAVVLVDLDLREPSIASIFDVSQLVGLTNVVMRQAELDEALFAVPLWSPAPPFASRPDATSLRGHLDILPTGPLPANPGEFVTSKAIVSRVLEPLRERFDYVIVDAPPMSVGGDAATLAARVDALIVVARLGVVRRDALADLKRQLDAIRTPALGFVLTGAKHSGGYGYGYYSTAGRENRSDLSPPTDEDVPTRVRRARS